MTSPAHVPAPTGLPTITFYVDFVSPYAWLAFTQLPQALEGLHYQVRYRPVQLGALLQAHGNPGPAGVTPKRAWTLRHAAWAGQHLGVGLDMPARHPFPPLPLLRLALEHSSDGDINRFVTDTVLRHVWLGAAPMPWSLPASTLCARNWPRNGTPTLSRPSSGCAPTPMRPRPQACSGCPPSR